MRTTITLRHFFNGSATGRDTKHRVRGSSGISRLQVRESGNGWGSQVWMTRVAAQRLGVYVHDCQTLLRCNDAPDGVIVVMVCGHDYMDPTVTTL
jgi:hypothetical protein